MRHRLNHGFPPFNAFSQEFSAMTNQDPPEDGPTQKSEFEALRDSMVFDGPELTFTPPRLTRPPVAAHCPSPRTAGRARMLRRGAATGAGKEARGAARLNAGQRRSTVPLSARVAKARCRSLNRPGFTGG